ncbi:hypothetical protein [Amphritea sp.]|uniref:hypothetical protein n=1 Tax=Amphritea sp. TaxID=1872502 RepID=UPI003D127CD1
MKILVIGDSHSIYFNLTNELRSLNESFKGVDVKVITIPGSTILGFGKRESTLNSRELFNNELLMFKPDFICFALGQVDIELGLYYRMVVKTESIDIDQYITSLCDAYIDTISIIQNEHQLPNSAIGLKGINLSVLTKSRDKAVNYTNRIITENIQDNKSIQQYKEKLSKLLPSNLERYSIHTRFNKALADKISGTYKYFDINDLIEDRRNVGHCQKIFIPSGHDHHILDSLYIRELSIERLIKSFLNLQTH